MAGSRNVFYTGTLLHQPQNRKSRYTRDDITVLKIGVLKIAVLKIAVLKRGSAPHAACGLHER